MATRGRRDESELSPQAQAWGHTTTAGILGGMVYGGLKEAVATNQPPAAWAGSSTPGLAFSSSQSAGRRLSPRELMERRLLRIMRGSVVGGAQLGCLTAVFAGTQWGLAEQRQQRDVWNTTVAGGVTASLLGLAMNGSLLSRLRLAGFNAVAGCTLAFPFGLLLTGLESLVPPEDDVGAKSPSGGASIEDTERSSDGLRRAIERLEERFNSWSKDVPQGDTKK